MQALEFYQNLFGDLEIEKQKLQRFLRNYRGVRLGIILATIIGTYSAFGNQLPFFVIILISIVLFLLVLAKYTDCKTALEIVQNKIKLIHA
jgi:hypothetical protein